MAVKRWQKFLLIGILVVLMLFLLFPLAVYLPPVQKAAIRYACSWVSENTPMKLSVEQFSIRFPFKPSFDKATISTPEGDTLLNANKLSADIALLPLLKKEIVIRGINLQDVLANITTPDSTMNIQARMGRLGIDDGDIILKEKSISVQQLQLTDAQINLLYKSKNDTTTNNTPLPDWSLNIDLIELNNIAYTMYMPSTIDTLSVVLPCAHIANTSVELSSQTISVDKVDIEQGNYRFISYARSDTLPTEKTTASIDTTKSEPWNIRVNRLELQENALAYITSPRTPIDGLDMTHINAQRINLAISNIYNSGSQLQLSVDSLSLQERSGLYLTQLSGFFAMTDGGIMELSDFIIQTPLSNIQANANIDMSLLEHNPLAPVNLNLKAKLSCHDMASLFPIAEKFFIHPYPKTSITSLSDIISADIKLYGTARDIEVETFDIIQQGYFTFQSDARMAYPLDDARRSIVLNGNLKTTEHITLSNYIPDSTLEAHIAMQPIHIDLHSNMIGKEITADMWMECMGGNADIQAQYNTVLESYDIAAVINSLPLDLFLPGDTIGNLSAHIDLSGKHFTLDNNDMALSALITVDTLQYRNFSYNGVQLAAEAANEHWNLDIASSLPSLDLDVNASGLFKKDLLTANIRAAIASLDLGAMHLSQQPLDIAADLTADIVLSNIDSIIQADIVIDSINIGMDEHRYRTKSLSLLAASDITYSYIDLRTGDMDINLMSDAGITHLRPAFERLTQFVDTIFTHQRLNMDELHRGLVPFELQANIGSNNLLQRYANNMGFRWSSAHFEASNDTLFSLGGIVNRMEISGMLLDTITLDAYEKESRLNYRLVLGNRPGNLDEFAHVQVEGFLSGNSTRLYCLQRNRKGEIGFMFGSKIDFKPDQIEFTFGPKEPIIGYKHWTLNNGNFVTYTYSKQELAADLKLMYENSHLFVTTDDRRNKDITGIHIDLQNIELADWLVATPLVTPMTGQLSSNIFVDIPPKGMEVTGTLDLKDFNYNHQRVGTFHADVDYIANSSTGNDINITMLHENNNILNFAAQIDNHKPQNIIGEIFINDLSLEVANAFFPANMGSLTGVINSHMDINGTLNSPQINGSIRLDKAQTTFKKIGASLAFDNIELPVKNSILYFNNYAIRGANKSPLTIDGIVDFTRLNDIAINLDFTGENFQPIQIAENRTGIIYGSVYTDIDAHVRGSFSDLKVNGNISLLSGTNATYIMQSGMMQTGTDYSDMVTFVSFVDTTNTSETEKANKKAINMTANVGINIDEGVQLGVNLSTDGKNRIDLVGGGNLLYTATPLGDNRVTGRYTLTGGFVRYTPPIITQKIFNIEDGSYVSWSGDIADPELNITAVQSQKSTVKNGEESRVVDFDIYIKISNTLNNLDISFDLATSDDLTIQNELQGLTAEQRETKAMNMFLYNSYDDFASGAENVLVNNSLNTFLEYELNTWAQRTLKGVDLTFGIDNYGIDGTGTQRTDYSYQFSKSLLDNRLKVVIGGSYASNQDVTQNLRENLIDDISIEYRITKRENMYLKAFRQSGYESIIEGEITQTGVGFLYRKQVMSLLDLFRRKPRTPKNKATENGSDSIPGDTIKVNIIPMPQIISPSDSTLILEPTTHQEQ